MSKKLEAIDNSNLSEALECLQQLAEMADKCWVSCDVHKWKNIIKQALLNEQENARSEEILQKYYQEGITLDSVRALKQERDEYKKILEIMKKKNVDILDIKTWYNYEHYCRAMEDSRLRKDWWLTEEEFNLLKEVLE